MTPPRSWSLRGLAAIAMLTTLLIGSVTGAFAAHNGNNRADVTGTGDPDAHGQAVVNYREGTGTFNGRITVQGLEPGEEYTFRVRGAGAGAVGVELCTDTANRQGTFSCSAQDLLLPGFTTAAVYDADGSEVATGLFDRRGNCRDPEQAGSLCDAPGHNH